MVVDANDYDVANCGRIAHLGDCFIDVCAVYLYVVLNDYNVKIHLSMWHSLGLILVSMVGYSTGCVIALRQRQFVPSLWDLLGVVGVWMVVFGIEEQFGRWSSLAIALLIGIMFGLLVTLARNAASDMAPIIPESELPEHAKERITQQQLSVWQRFKRGWASYGERMGNVQGRLLMGFFYFIVVLPFGLISRIGTDALTIKSKPTQSAWVAWNDATSTLDEAQEQG